MGELCVCLFVCGKVSGRESHLGSCRNVLTFILFGVDVDQDSNIAKQTNKTEIMTIKQTKKECLFVYSTIYLKEMCFYFGLYGPRRSLSVKFYVLN